MGMDFGLPEPMSGNSKLCKRKNRWLFKIDGISADQTSISSLPPQKAARPSLQFKEMEVRHLNEHIYYPQKPEWKPITLTLYDIKTDVIHPIFDWIFKIYEPDKTGDWHPVVRTGPISNRFLKDGILELYDGCGNTIERWTFEQCWPQNVEWGDLDMGSSEIVMCDITLRYARAFTEILTPPPPDDTPDQNNGEGQNQTFTTNSTNEISQN